MTPVILLTDGYIANASEPWRVPDLGSRKRFPVSFREDPEGFEPFIRDPKTLARPWVKPGTAGLAHRIGGIEKASGSGHISYDPANHQKMTDLRAAKILGIASDVPKQEVELGNAKGRLAVVGWGSTYGPISRAVSNMDGSMHIYQWHQEGFEVPDGATVLAHGKGHFPNQAFRYGDSVYGMQFHPEVDASVFSNWLDEVKDVHVEGVEGRRGPVLDDSIVLIQAAVAGRGVALGRSSLIRDELADGRLVAPFDVSLASDMAYYLVHPPGAAENPKVRAFCDFLKEEVARDAEQSRAQQ